MEDINKLKLLESLNYDAFKKTASNPELSIYEKIGFPNSYREEYEEKIFMDIDSKLNITNSKNKKILDIGCGCSNLVNILIDTCAALNHELHLIDSEEMLGNIANNKGYISHPGYFPEMPDFLDKYANFFDNILCYSLIHYVFEEGNIFKFIDKACSLLNSGGSLLIGDIPNYTKRARFFLSEKGIHFHREYVADKEAMPNIKTYQLDEKRIDDGVVMSILMRYRNYGFETYLLPQKEDLPLANRREDILIVKR